MADANKIVRERQKAIRREIDRRGIAIKAIQLDAGWDTPSTVLSYFPGNPEVEPAVMSVSALYRLIDTKALPAELLSMLLPAGFAIIQVPEGINHEELATAAAEYLAAKNAAHHPESEAQRDIGPNEKRALDTCALKLVVNG